MSVHTEYRTSSGWPRPWTVADMLQHKHHVYAHIFLRAAQQHGVGRMISHPWQGGVFLAGLVHCMPCMQSLAEHDGLLCTHFVV